MLLALAIVGVFVLPEPWGLIALPVAAVVEVAEVFLWIRFLRRYLDVERSGVELEASDVAASDSQIAKEIAEVLFACFVRDPHKRRRGIRVRRDARPGREPRRTADPIPPCAVFHLGEHLRDDRDLPGRRFRMLLFVLGARKPQLDAGTHDTLGHLPEVRL